jgi:hypothetical protein
MIPGRVVDRHREPEADAGDRRVDPDDAAAAVRERAARVARVQGRVGLDHVLHHASGPGRERATQRAHDPGRHAPGEAHRVADRDDELADAQARCLAQLSRDEALALQAEDRHVRQAIAADHVERDLPPVDERGGAAVRAADHVGRGQHEPVGGDHHAGAGAVHSAAAPSLPDPEARDRRDQTLGHRGHHPGVRVERLVVRPHVVPHLPLVPHIPGNGVRPPHPRSVRCSAAREGRGLDVAALRTFGERFRGEVILPGSADYDDARGLERDDRSPAGTRDPLRRRR